MHGRKIRHRRNHVGVGFKYVYSTADKFVARSRTIVEAYPKYTGRTTVPLDRQYWCLCAEQPDDSLSEINQLVDAHIIHPGQFHGVDRDPEKIERNRSIHPHAHWHCGEWIDVIEKQDHFSPGIVYFDTLNVGDNPLVWGQTAITMVLCPPGTFLAVNVMLNNPYATGTAIRSPEDFVKGVASELPHAEAKRWDALDRKFYTYQAQHCRTRMATFMFLKKER